MSRPTPEALILHAPFDGWCASLDHAPDPVFAGRLLGDGMALDPTSNLLCAPCDGEIVAVPASRHAVTLRAPNGLEVLLHVGIDTVGLGGEGFETLVGTGTRVTTGTPLLRFDLDGLAQRAKSLVTPVVVLGDGCAVERLVADAIVRTGQPVARVTRTVDATTRREDAAATAVSSVTRTVRVALAHGLHARPAARIAQVVRGADGTRVSVARGTQVADARSVTALMALGVRVGDDLELRAEGATGTSALDAIAGILTTPEAASHAPAVAATTGQSPGKDSAAGGIDSTGALRAVIASRGLALGPAHRLRVATFDVPSTGRGAMIEMTALRDALQSVRADLTQRATTLDGTHAELAAAHALLLDDPALVEAAERGIERGHGAGHAWRTATAAQAQVFAQLDDAYLRERAADLRDLEAQVLTALGLARTDGVGAAVPDGAIVLADDLLPSQFAALDATRLGGICTSAGGPTSHVAILAAAAGIPMLVAVGPAIADVVDGTIVLLDGLEGRLQLAPEDAVRAQAAARIASARERRERERAAAQRDAHTADGSRVHVYANLGAPGEATQAVALGAEGCGLLRSEFLFLDRHTAPSEDEQRAMYQDTATRLEGRTLTIRTLDVGGDKPLDYLPMPAEDNPALGLRGVRTSLYRPELLREQLRAILRVEPAGQCRILLPMITDAAEISAVRAVLTECIAALGATHSPSLGVMIETPAAAVLADTLAPHVDFFSIGTNDLTQYTLAMDRTHPQLASRLDGLHPAVLRLIARVCEAAGVHDREVAVCGSLGMDDAAIPVLLGLGVQELSVAHAALPAVKARVASLELPACRALARLALTQSTAADVRRLVQARSPILDQHTVSIT